MTIEAIDFGRLYRDHMTAAGRRPKSAEEWNGRAGNVGARLVHGNYATDFVARMDLQDCESLLDVGCGNGAICLLLAPKLKKILALDYSNRMLDVLRAEAEAQSFGNIEPVLRAWEDDWSDLPECDIVVASRSTQVEDMAAALAKLHAKARKRVYLTHRAGGHFIDPEILSAIGRHHLSLPDYIYILNILHAMKIRPRVDYLDGGEATAISSFEELVRKVIWSIGELDERELQRLREWHDHRVAQQSPIMMPARQWAFISWEKDGG